MVFITSNGTQQSERYFYLSVIVLLFSPVINIINFEHDYIDNTKYFDVTVLSMKLLLLVCGIVVKWEYCGEKNSLRDYNILFNDVSFNDSIPGMV